MCSQNTLGRIEITRRNVLECIFPSVPTREHHSRVFLLSVSDTRELSTSWYTFFRIILGNNLVDLTNILLLS